MSTFKVPVSQIKQVLQHSNADKLEIAVIFDWNVVIPKGKYKAGDYVIYCPIDALLPQWLEDKMFGNSKVKLHKHRVRQIKIRGFSSQGLIIPIEEVLEHVADYAKAKGLKEFSIHPDMDLSETLGIKKYEPEEVLQGVPGQKTPRNKPLENKYLHKFGGIENYKWYPDLFKDVEEVVIEEKLHGTNARYGLLPTEPNTLWKKIKLVFGMLPKYEFVWGSNNVQLQHKDYSKTGYYEEDVYSKMTKKLNIKSKLLPGETIYGEIIGPGIQKNYHYGIPQGEHRFVLFDVRVYDGEKSYFLNPEQVEEFAKKRGFEMTPVLYKGPFNAQIAKDLSKGDSIYAPSQKIREGIVIKSRYNINDSSIGKKMLKLISEDYLSDFSNSDFH